MKKRVIRKDIVRCSILCMFFLLFTSVVHAQYPLDFTFLTQQVDANVCVDNPSGGPWVDNQVGNYAYLYLADNYDSDSFADDFLFVRSNFKALLNLNSGPAPTTEILARILWSNGSGPTTASMYQPETNMLQRMPYTVGVGFGAVQPMQNGTFNRPSFAMPNNTFVRGIESDNNAIVFEQPASWVSGDPATKRQVGIRYNYQYQFSIANNGSADPITNYFYYSTPDGVNSWYGPATLNNGSYLGFVAHPSDYVETNDPALRRNLPSGWSTVGRGGTWGYIDGGGFFSPGLTAERSNCQIFELSRCGDGILDDSVTTNYLNYNNISEQCDPGTSPGVGDDVFRAPFSAAGYTCASDCTVQQAPVCETFSPIINPNPTTDAVPLTFSCNTINNPGGEIRVYRNGTLQQSLALNASGDGSITIPAANINAGETWSVECVDVSGTVLQYDGNTDPCSDSIIIGTATGPACSAFAISSTLGQTVVIPVNSTGVGLACQFFNHNPVVPPDGMIVNGGFVNPGSLQVGSNTILFSPVNTSVPGMGTFSCYIATGRPPVLSTLCEGEYYIIDQGIEKFQGTTGTLTATTPYGITNQQDGGVGGYMSLNGFSRIYYRLSVSDIGLDGPSPNAIGDTMPANATSCTWDQSRTTPIVSGPTSLSPGGLSIWFVPNDGSLRDVEIVYYCDFAPGSQRLEFLNTASLETNYAVLGQPIDDVVSNLVAAEYLPISTLNLRKTQGTGWDSVNDPSGFDIVNVQGSLVSGAMDVTNFNKIYYRLLTYNAGVDLDQVEINDVFPFANCVVENIVTNHAGTHSPVAPFGQPVTNPLWTATNFLAGDEVTIIVSCDVPSTVATYQNQFRANATLNGIVDTFSSNIVNSEVRDTILTLDKTQRNDTRGNPVPGPFGSGALLFSAGDVFVFQLEYANNGSGTMTNVQVEDVFPTGFILQQSSHTGGVGGLGLSCNGLSPVVFPVSGVQNCIWNIGNLAPGATGLITLTGVMTTDTGGFYYNTGNIYSNGVLFDYSVVQQIPDATLFPPDLDLTKTQVTSINSGYTSPCDPINCQHSGLPINTQNNYYLSYQIEVVNNGTGYATGVQIYDLLPEGFIPVSVTGGLGTIPAFCNVPTNNGSGQYELICSPTQVLPGGGSIIIQIDGFVVTDSTPYFGTQTNIASYVNTASVITTSGTDCLVHFDPDCSDTVIATVPGSPFLDVNKDFAQTIVAPGDPVQFTLLYYNLGSAPVTGAYLQDVFPQGLTYISHTPASVPFSGNSFDVSVLYPSGFGPSPNPGIPVIVQAVVDTGYTGTGITNTAYFCAPGLTCAVDDDSLVLQYTTGFSITKTAQDLQGNSISSVASGQTFTYVIDFVNNGTTTLNTYQITDTLPATVTHLVATFQAIINGGTPQVASPNVILPTLTWNCTNGSSASLPTPCTLPPGGTGQITFDVTVN